MTRQEFGELSESMGDLSSKVSGLLDKVVQFRLTDESRRDREEVEGSIESDLIRPLDSPASFLVEAYQLGTFGRIGVCSFTGPDASKVYRFTRIDLHMSYRHHGGGWNGHTLAYPWSGKPVMFWYVFNRENADVTTGEWCTTDPFDVF